MNKKGCIFLISARKKLLKECLFLLNENYNSKFCYPILIFYHGKIYDDHKYRESISSINNKVEYKANTDHPLFDVLRKVVLKHLGLEDLVETVLARMGDVDQIILVGDYARGNDTGNIEVFLIGKGLNMDYITQLENKIEDLIGRKVSFYLASKFSPDREHIILFNSKL